jgi:hypothetical protein
MSRQYTKIPAHKPPPRKKLIRPVAKMSAVLGKKSAFKSMGSK